MSGSHPLRWIVLLMFGALTAFGCVGTDTSQQGETGSLSLDLVIGEGVVINEVQWRITGNDMDMSGTIDVSAPGSTASVEVFGLPPGDEDYTVTLTALSEDDVVSCKGSTDFNVEVGESTPVMVVLNCKLPQQLGSVRVNGKFNICAQLIKATAAPLQTSVGNDIDLTSQGEDAEDDPIAYNWTATGGSIDDPSAASTTYTCGEAGDHKIVISVTDNDDYCDMATWTFPVTCVLGEVECQNDDDCDEDEVCVAGECVPDVECVTPADCDDDNDCTANICADGMCANPNSDADEMCDQDGGSVCDGDGACVECNSDMQCDAFEVCTENACVPDNRCSMDINCADGNQCTRDVCFLGSCSNPNEEPGATCDQDGGSVCDGDGNCVECNGDAQCDMGEVCVANECVADVECMIDDDCGVDEICVDNDCVSDPDVFCNEGLCATNETARANCVQAFLACLAGEPVNEEECIGLGLAQCNVECIIDGDCDAGEVCTDGTCVPDVECNMDSDCDDENQCTANTCADGTCVYPSLDPDVSCDQDGGSFCDGDGNCVECNNALQCPGGGECKVPACESNACGLADAPDGTACLDNTGTCDAGQCVPNALAIYAQDFEPPMDPANGDALIEDTAAEVPLGAWLFFANVFDSAGNLKFPYGPFGAPNATVSPSDTFISAVVTGEGDTPQGDQQLSVFSDYNCCDPDPISGELRQGHGNGTDRVQINVFQELNPIPESLIGQTLTFSFDAKRGNIELASTALAFITTLDPSTGFSQTNFVPIDLTSIPATWNRYEITLDLTATELEGQILQIGFRNTAQDFEGSGIFYDNVLAELTPAP